MIPIFMLVLGIVMIAAPQAVMKKEQREDMDLRKKFKRRGIFLSIIVVIWIGIDIIRLSQGWGL